jgi:glycosyltransferase involved in cell wall biosynthesis
LTSVLLDAISLGDDSAYRGIGTYVRGLLGGLVALEGETTVQLGALASDAAELPPEVRRVPVSRAAPGRFRRLEHELRLPLDLARAPGDVFHSPGLDPPLICRRPWVQTLHDVIPLQSDDPSLAVERGRWRRQAARYRRAARVIAISEYTAQVGIATLGIDPRRIEVVPHGVDPRYRPAGPGDGRDGDPYLLLVGEYSPRKRYPEAFSLIAELARRGHPHRLHVTGRIAPWVRPTVEGLAAAALRPERIVLRDFVPDLVAEYQGASAMIMTSAAEGFGLPLLEAMACGVPVVAFANTAVTEVVGDGGVLVPDGEIGAMADAVAELLDDRTRHRAAVARGLAWSRRFTWAASAAAHAAIYRAVVSSSR